MLHMHIPTCRSEQGLAIRLDSSIDSATPVTELLIADVPDPIERRLGDCRLGL